MKKALVSMFYWTNLLIASALFIPEIRSWFNYIGERWSVILIQSFSICYALIPLLIKISIRFDFLDRPSGRKQHERATPLLGGIGIIISFIGSFVANFILSPKTTIFLIAALVIAIVCIFDDLFDLPASAKLIVQILCAIAVICSGAVIKLFPVDGVRDVPWLALLFQIGNWAITIFWIVGIINALNFLDGMDGLASGISATIALLIGIVSFQNDQFFLGWLCVALLGSCFGFLPYNFRLGGPALIYLGDAGSNFLGFVLAYLAVEGNWALDKPWVAISSPLLIFGILIYDMVHITVNRVRSGRVSSFRELINYTGRDHIHHRFAMLLDGRKRSVLFILLLNICLGANAILLRNATLLGTLVLALQFIGITVIVTILEYVGNKKGGSYDFR